MRFATIDVEGIGQPCLVDSDAGRYWPLDGVAGMLELIAGFDTLKDAIRPAGDGLPLAGAAVRAPIPRPARNIMCVGKNYFDHAHEFARSGFDSSAAVSAVPKTPIIFTKAPQTVIANGEAIRYPHGLSDCIDYEAELAVIIGKPGRGIAPGDAFAHVWGYTIVNDVTSRDLQQRHQQWFLGKSIDTFCPMGPFAVTADEVDAENLDVRCWVNGELRQEANTRDLIFGIPALISTISAGMTLLPGDIIATGTPAGVGIGFDPPKYLKPGDEVAVQISGLGRLVNRVA